MMEHGSCGCSKSELDVISVPPTMASMVDGQWTEHYPIVNPKNNNAPIEFMIPAQSEKWSDFNQSYLRLLVKITKDDDSEIEDDTNLSTVNNFFHSLFSSIDLYLNNKLIPSTDKYPYRAFLENLLGTDYTYKVSVLDDLELFHMDTPVDVNKNVKTDGGVGWLSRNSKIKGKYLEMVGNLHLDLFLQEKYLPNGIDIRLKLNRSSTDFCLMGSDGKGKIEIIEAGYNVRTVQLTHTVANNLYQSIAKNNMRIPIRRVVMKTFTITAGLQSKIDDYTFLGQLPKRLFLGMVKNSDMNGNPQTNPFNFQHFKISKLDISIDGKSIHNKPLEPDFSNATNKKTLQSYLSLMNALGAKSNDCGPGLPLNVYENGHTLWGFDLTADQGSEEGHLHPIKTGNIRIEIAFSEALVAPVNVIIYAEYDNQIEINGIREVMTDY